MSKNGSGNIAKNVNVAAKAVDTAGEGLGSIMTGIATVQNARTQAYSTVKEQERLDRESYREQDRLDRAENRADNESLAGVATTNSNRMIAEDEHRMKREIHNNDMNLTHIKSSIEATNMVNTARSDTVKKLIEDKKLLEEAIAAGFSKEEVEAARAKEEEKLLMSNPVYRDNLMLRKQILELEVERELIMHQNLQKIEEVFADIVIDAYKYDLDYRKMARKIKNIIKIHTDKDGVEYNRLPDGIFKVERLEDDNIVIQFSRYPSDVLDLEGRKIEGNIESKEVILEERLYEDGLKPEELDIIKIDGRKISLKAIDAYRNDTFRVRRWWLGDKDTPFETFSDWLRDDFGEIDKSIKGFYISSTAREEIRKVACEVRGRDFLTLREKNDLQGIYEKISKGIARHFKNQDVRQFVTGNSDGIVGKTFSTLGYGLEHALMNGIGAGVFVTEKASEGFEAASSGLSSLKKKLFSK